MEKITGALIFISFDVLSYSQENETEFIGSNYNGYLTCKKLNLKGSTN